MRNDGITEKRGGTLSWITNRFVIFSLTVKTEDVKTTRLCHFKELASQYNATLMISWHHRDQPRSFKATSNKLPATWWPLGGQRFWLTIRKEIVIFFKLKYSYIYTHLFSGIQSFCPNKQKQWAAGSIKDPISLVFNQWNRWAVINTQDGMSQSCSSTAK